MCIKVIGFVGSLILISSIVTDTFAENDSQQDIQSLETIIQEVARGWEQASAQPFQVHFLDQPGARYIEGGGQNNGLDDLVDHHVIPEGEYLTNFNLRVDPVEIHIEGNMAWAITNVEITGIIKKDNRKIHSRGFQTILFRKMSESWKIIHTHSSSRPVKEEKHEH